MGVKTRLNTHGDTMSQYKSITIRLSKDSELFQELQRRKEAEEKPWATVTQDLLHQAHRALLRKSQPDMVAPQTRYPSKYVNLKNNQKVYSRVYVQEIESLLSSFLLCKSHPRKGEG